MWVTSNLPLSPEDREREGRDGKKSGMHSAGETTPVLKRSPALELPGSKRERGAERDEGKLARVARWFDLAEGRRWDWDRVAREVGWPIGGLLLLTLAWMFWGIETGRLKRA
jgi:hypothetical protein